MAYRAHRFFHLTLFRRARMSWPRRLRLALVACLLALLAWAALAPLGYRTRERAFDFPSGAGAVSVPGEVRLALGVRDVLLLRNRDSVPHVFGQVTVPSRRAFRLPFEQAGSYPFACDAAPGKRVTVRVVPEPDPGWERVAWRWEALKEALRDMPLEGPGT